MRRFLRENSLGLFFGALFLGAWLAQSPTGWNVCNHAIYLRQGDSPESKPVGAAHTDTGVEG